MDGNVVNHELIASWLPASIGFSESGRFSATAIAFSFNPNINRALIAELTSGWFIQEKVCALIVGPRGTGKSYIAQAPWPLRHPHRLRCALCQLRKDAQPAQFGFALKSDLTASKSHVGQDHP
ncbi:MAG: ATP-binding protein [Desulfobacterales bacterium]|nr:ATP-binding protein [Desulfobacterales bacterium]